MNQRIQKLNQQDVDKSGSHVLYVMARDQRIRDNHALIAAQDSALELNLPLVAVFNLLGRTGDRAL